MEKTILVVEDDLETLNLVVEFLEKKGYRIFKASNGFKALEILDQEKINLLLTDIRMPKMNGFELVKAVKKKYQKLGIIIMTAFTSIYSEGDIREIGVDDYIVKPFNISVLYEKVDSVFLQISLLKHK